MTNVRPFGKSTVADRLRELSAGPSELRFLGSPRPGGPLTIEVGPDRRRRELAAVAMVDWLHGYLAGEVAPLVDDPDLSVLDSAKSVLVHPTYEDQLRVRIRVGMERTGIGITELAKRMGVTKKTVLEATRFGRGGYLAIFVPLDDEERVSHDMAEADPEGPVTIAPPSGWPEPPTVARVRLLAYAHQQGLVDWVGPHDINKASSPALGVEFELRRSDETFKVTPAGLPVWLLGVADACAPELAEQFAGRIFDPTMIDGLVRAV